MNFHNSTKVRLVAAYHHIQLWKSVTLFTLYLVKVAREESRHGKNTNKLGFVCQETFEYEGDMTDWFELSKATWENGKWRC
jgi:hypothetical protein